MTFFPIFLSVLVVLRNRSEDIESIISEITDVVSTLVTDYELIVIDNASDDGSVALLKKLTAETGIPNLQVYALTKEVDADTASSVGLENALGDFVAVIDPLADDIAFLPDLLDKAVSGSDVVFATNRQQAVQRFAYRRADAIFNGFYKLLSGVDLMNEAPKYRILSRKVVNFILRYAQPAIAYRLLPTTGGFSRANLAYSAAPRNQRPKRLKESMDRGIRLLFSTTRAPMRLVTILSLFGAISNVFYTFYVVAVGVLKADVAPGWISLSLQQSGMFFLISLVLLVLGEYILIMVQFSNQGPPYHIAQEFMSARITGLARRNIEAVVPVPERQS